MKAILCTKYGSPDGLQLKEIEKPVPKDNEVLIRIHATTVTSGDVILRKLPLPLRLVFGLKKNSILGHELAGEVEKVGKDVTLFELGDKVFASTGKKSGTYTEYISLPEDGMIALKPENLNYGEAAAVPVGANTALHILRKGNIQSGQKVLVYGASGSVGTYAIQLAKHFGAEVTGVCSASNVDLVNSLGADKVIDYAKEDITKGKQTYDVIFDAVGKITGSRIRNLLTENGIYLSVRSSTRELVKDLVFIKNLIESGKIKPVIDRHFPLEQTAEAHRYVEKGHKKGNVIITVTPREKGAGPIFPNEINQRNKLNSIQQYN